VKKEEKKENQHLQRKEDFRKKEEKYRRFVFKPSNHKKIAVKLNSVKSFSLLASV
jgi:hypothetical protein